MIVQNIVSLRDQLINLNRHFCYHRKYQETGFKKKDFEDLMICDLPQKVTKNMVIIFGL